MRTLKLIFITLLFAGNGYAQGHLQVVEPESAITTEEVAGKDYLKVDTNDADEVFITVDKAPRFPAGEERMWKYIAENMQYPEEAMGRGIQGQVGVKFIVRKTGLITDVQVERSVHPLLDNEAVRLVQNMPKWIPADFRGQAVSTPYELYIFFKIKN